MHITGALFLICFVIHSKSASFERKVAESELFSDTYLENGDINELESEDHKPAKSIIELENEDYEDTFETKNNETLLNDSNVENVNLGAINSIYISENDISENENNDEITAFGYHMKVGIPKAIELMKSEGQQSRIIGGNQVAGSSIIPHQAGIVALLTTGWQSICGGALISNSRVLTAAHCWWDGENQAKVFTIVLGSTTILTGGTRLETSLVTVHPNWNTRDITNDIAMATINSISFNNDIQAIPLPTLAEVNLDFAGMTGTVSGYGKTTDAQTGTTTNLHQVSVNIIMNSVCQSSFQTVTLHNSHMCTSGTGKVGSCDGDSGGPLTTVYNNQRILVGVVSFGLSEGCQFGNPSVYSRVTTFLNWIHANM